MPAQHVTTTLRAALCCAVHRWLQTCAWALRSSALCVERLRLVRCPRVLDHDLYTLGQYRQLRLLVLDHCVSLSDEASGMIMIIIIMITVPPARPGQRLFCPDR
eukprot:COSAG01_NODE_294_length_19294_cov_35.559312_18_plen_104_part_00